MKLKLYQIDAFSSKVFSGNPAAVCPLQEWLDDDTLQNIAAENNLSETAFFVKRYDRYEIRWFTPTAEVDLCGHATLASGFVINKYIEKSMEQIKFESKSGQLTVNIEGDLISLDFPARIAEKTNPPKVLTNALGKAPKEARFNKTYLLVYDVQETLEKLEPEVEEFLKVKTHGVIITAPGNNVDFVSRFFAPDVGIKEDPVTGYAHTLLIPYWAERLNKNKLNALQLSKRGGELKCEYLEDRVKIAGYASLYLEGNIYL